jgi:hypothetical protein
MSLYVALAFEHRNHRGPWRLTAEDGWSIVQSEGALQKIIPYDQNEGLSDKMIESMIESNKTSGYAVHAVASPL